MKQQIKPIKKYIILEILLDIFCTLLSATLPIVQKLFFDSGIQSGLQRLIQIIALYVTIHILHIALSYLCMYCTWKGAIQFEKSLKDDFFSAVFRMEYKEFYKRPIAEYISMQANDITTIEQDYLQPLVDVIRSVNMLIVYGSVMILFVDTRIAMVTILVSVLVTIIPQLYGKKISQKRNDYVRQQATYTTVITDLLNGFLHISKRTIDAIMKVHEKALQETAQKRMQFGKVKMLSLSINQLAISTVQIVTLSMTMVLFAQGEITVGTAVAALGYCSPESGRVSMDGADVQGLDMTEVISYINQSEHVFAADFAKNVSVFGSYHMKQLSHFDDKLCTKAMYERLSTMDDCQQLSGGEKQVLAIIRALLKNTPVLVMDEPFSALDVANKRKVENYILCSEEMKEKTLITVTHDLSEDSLNLYDEILQMDGGRLVAYDRRKTS